MFLVPDIVSPDALVAVTVTVYAFVPFWVYLYWIIPEGSSLVSPVPNSNLYWFALSALAVKDTLPEPSVATVAAI